MPTAAPSHRPYPASHDAGRDVDFRDLVPLFHERAGLAPGDPRRDGLRERLIVGHLPLAHHAARRYAQAWIPYEDVVQVATVGLINAVDRYDPGRGSSFLAFAVPTVTGEIRRHFRDHGWAMRMPRHLQDLHREVARASDRLAPELGHLPSTAEVGSELGVTADEVRQGVEAGVAARSLSLDHPLGDGGDTYADVAGAADTGLGQADERETVRPLLAALSPTERHVLYLRFFCDLPQAVIGRQIGYSQMHVSRLLDRVLTRLHDQATAA